MKIREEDVCGLGTGIRLFVENERAYVAFQRKIAVLIYCFANKEYFVLTEDSCVEEDYNNVVIFEKNILF